MKSSGFNRRRLAVGLLVGVVFGVGLASSLLAVARRAEQNTRAERVSVVELRALVDLVERAGSDGDAVRRAVGLWSASHASLRAARVLAFEGISLEASTAPEDRGEKAAPRRLDSTEKPIYDLGQRLRAAVQTNREEGTPRKNEIEIRAGPGGTLGLAAPYERDGMVVGIVEVVTVPAPAPAPLPIMALAASFLAPIALFFLLAPALGARRILCTLLAAVLLIGSVAICARLGTAVLTNDRRAMEHAVAASVTRERVRATSVLHALALEGGAPLAPDAWDADLYRRPRGLVSGAGTIDEARLSTQLALVRENVGRTAAGIGAAAVLLFGLVGLGAASRLGAAAVRYHQAYAYALPAMLGMTVLVFFPFIYGIAVSFTDATLYNTDKPLADIWVGLKNYAEILGDFSIVKETAGGLVFNYLNFYWTFFFTIVWTVSNVSLGVASGLILALILNTRGLKFRPIYRVLLILPWAVPNYITALVWRGMFHQQFGVINQAIQIFGGTPLAWFDTPFTSFLTVLATNGWLSFPFMMVVSLGALQSISGEMYEAARIDGATRWQQFRTITLPSLKPALIPAIILSVIWTFNMFNIIYLVTQGEPGSSTEILITQSYKFAFEKYRYGYAAAYSTVIFMILLIYGVFQNRVTRATEAIQ